MTRNDKDMSWSKFILIIIVMYFLISLFGGFVRELNRQAVEYDNKLKSKK